MNRTSWGLALCLAMIAVASASRAQSIFDDGLSKKSATNPAIRPTAPRDDAPASTNGTPTTTASVKTPLPAARHEVPDAVSQIEARKLIDELFKDKIAAATSPQEKSTLARELIAIAADPKTEPPQRYVLLKQAGELAVAAMDVETMDAADDLLSARFIGDRVATKLATWDAAGKVAKERADFAKLAHSLGDWLDRQRLEDHPDALIHAASAAAALAARSGDSALVTQCANRLRDAKEVEAAYALLKPHLAKLADNPADPGANLALGRYYCFTHGNWSKGLPMLAQGSDERLRTLAKQEMEATPDAMALADHWWEAADHERALAQQQVRVHAVYWYRRAIPTALGLAKLKAERRVKDVDGAQMMAAAGRANAAAQVSGASLQTVSGARPGKLLLIFPKNERDAVVEACKKYQLPYDLADHFDHTRADYSAYGTIICGTNMMDYWGGKPERKETEAFRFIDHFIEKGGHLVIFGSFNGRNMEQLLPYGIKTSYYHGDYFQPVPGASDLLFEGNEDLVPKDGMLHTAGNFKCTSPHVVLIARVKKDQKPDGPLMITMPWKAGRITFNLVEPSWKQPHDGMWLIPVTIGWISRGSPMGDLK